MGDEFWRLLSSAWTPPGPGDICRWHGGRSTTEDRPADGPRLSRHLPGVNTVERSVCRALWAGWALEKSEWALCSMVVLLEWLSAWRYLYVEGCTQTISLVCRHGVEEGGHWARTGGGGRPQDSSIKQCCLRMLFALDDADCSIPLVSSSWIPLRVVGSETSEMSQTREV